MLDHPTGALSISSIVCWEISVHISGHVALSTLNTVSMETVRERNGKADWGIGLWFSYLRGPSMGGSVEFWIRWSIAGLIWRLRRKDNVFKDDKIRFCLPMTEQIFAYYPSGMILNLFKLIIKNVSKKFYLFNSL